MNNADNFRAAVEQFIAKRDDGTKPEDGWPWPWEDSRTTDYAYAFDEGKVWASGFGYRWYDLVAYQAMTSEQREKFDESTPRTKEAEFPNMKDRQAVTLGKRSGVLVFGLK